MFAKSYRKIGLDIGSYAIKMIEVSSSKSGDNIVNFGYAKAPGAEAEGLAESIKKMLSDSKAAAKEVNMSISGPQVITRFVSMPAMSDKDLRGALAFEVEKNIPFGADEVIYDYQVLERGKEKRMDILLAAVKKDYVERHMRLAKLCGLNPNAIDVDSFALANAFMRRPESRKDASGTVALVNIGSRFTNLGIIRGGTLGFSRDIQIAGHDVDETIARILGVDVAAAEKLKSGSDSPRGEAGTAIRTVLASLVDEIRLSFGYFENRYGKNVEAIFLSGGSCRLPELKEILEEGIGIKAAAWNPLKVFAATGGVSEAITSKGLEDSFAVSVGLALR